MSKIFKCGDCGHISRLEQRKITHARTCKAVTRRKADTRHPAAQAVTTITRALVKAKAVRRIKPTRAGYPGNEEWQKLSPAAPVDEALLTRDQFVAKLLSIKGDKSLHDFAPDLKVSYQFLGHVIKGDYPVGPKIAEALGYEPVVMFRKGKKPARVPKIDKRQMKLPIPEKTNATATASN